MFLRERLSRGPHAQWKQCKHPELDIEVYSNPAKESVLCGEDRRPSVTSVSAGPFRTGGGERLTPATWATNIEYLELARSYAQSKLSLAYGARVRFWNCLKRLTPIRLGETTVAML